MSGLLLVVGGRSAPWGQDLPGSDDEPAAVVAAGQSPGDVLARLVGLPATSAVVTVAAMTDTLKLVDRDGLVLGTADREQHRLVGTPIAASLGALRAARTATSVIELCELLAADLDVVPLAQ